MITSGASSPVAARTPPAGYTLQNGTGTILSCTTPNDGQLHPVLVSSVVMVSALETGGQVTITFRLNGQTVFLALSPGGLAAGQYQSSAQYIADPGTAITISQNSALSAGAAVFNGALSVL